MLGTRQADGATLREHLRVLAQQTGRTPEQLEPVEVPGCVLYLWDWFVDLSNRREAGMGVSTLTWPQIDSWCRLKHVVLSPLELDAITQIDDAYVAHQMAQQAKDGKHG